MTTLVSIIIPAFNEEKHIDKCLNSLFNLNYPREHLEIIIVDDGSTDNTPNILKKYEIKVVKTDHVGPAQARNEGIKQAKGKFIAFTDADCIVDKEWINELMKGFTYNDKVAGVGGIQKIPDDETEFGKIVQKYFEIINFIGGYVKRYKEIKEVDHNPTCNVIYRKEILKNVKGFKKGLWPGEDVEIDHRIRKLGYILLYNPRAVVYHYRPKNFREFYNMMRKYGKFGGGYLFKKYGFFRKLYYEPFILLFILLALTIFSFFHLKISFFLILIFLFSPLIYFTFKFLNLKMGIKLCLLFLINIFSWNLGFLEGLFLKNSNE